MLRKIIWFLVALLIIGVVFYAYQYNNELQQILANINFDTAIIMEKIRSISEKLNSQTTTGSAELLSGATNILSGAVNTLSGDIVEITSEATEVISGAIN